MTIVYLSYGFLYKNRELLLPSVDFLIENATHYPNVFEAVTQAKEIQDFNAGIRQ